MRFFCDIGRFLAQKIRAAPAGAAPFTEEIKLLVGHIAGHAVLVGLDHLLDHLAADRACLTGGQITVIALVEIYTNFVCSLHLELLKSLLCLLVCHFVSPSPKALPSVKHPLLTRGKSVGILSIFQERSATSATVKSDIRIAFRASAERSATADCGHLRKTVLFFRDRNRLLSRSEYIVCGKQIFMIGNFYVETARFKSAIGVPTCRALRGCSKRRTGRACGHKRFICYFH